MKYKIVRLTRWQDIQKYAKQGWIFRGQSEAKWDLKTSLDRCFDRHKIPGKQRPELERLLGREFRRTYHLYAQHVPKEASIVEWLSLMQHHGAPTRLLDFTYSPYVATYFAAETARTACAVWAVDAPWIREEARKLIAAKRKDISYLEKYWNREEDESTMDKFIRDKPFVPACLPTNAFRTNERLRIQQGAFLIQCDVRRSFMQNLMAHMSASNSRKHFIKIIIPPVVGKKAIRDLYSMAISRTTLFPGLDGFAHSLGIWSSAYRPTDWFRYRPRSVKVGP